MANCFLFFRLWPGFSEPFPFDRFDGIAKDDELLQALNSWAREEIKRPEVRQAIMQAARWRKHNWLVAMKRRRNVTAMRPAGFSNRPTKHPAKQYTARDVYWPRIRQPERPEPLVCRFGSDLGWWREVGLFGADIPLWRERGDNSIPFGPRVWFYQVPSRELAETVVLALNGRTDLHFDDHKVEHYLQPRFGFIEDTEVALRISARRCITSIQQEQIPEVRSGEMALAMGHKAIPIAKEMLEAVALSTSVQAVSASPEPDQPTNSTGSTPTDEDDATPKKGVSLRHAAEKIRPKDPEGQNKLLEAWRKSRTPKLPDPIGKSKPHKQRNLYEPAALLAFLKKFEGKSVDGDFGLSGWFRKVSDFPRPQE